MLFILIAGSAQGAIYMKVTKNNAVIGYKEPSTQSKPLKVFSAGEEVQVLMEKDGWYKIKIPFNQQGYYLTGWVPKSVGHFQLVRKNNSNSPDRLTFRDNPSKEPVKKEPSKRHSTGLDRSVSPSMDRWDSDSTQFVRFFAGPVYNLYHYGAFQYKFGLSYEIPLTQSDKLGIMGSYTTGDIFNITQIGLENMYSFYFSWFAVSPRIGVGYEYIFGNGTTRQAISTEGGFSFDVSISNHFTIGVEPLTAQAMLWSSAPVPFNIRGQSMLLLRGRW